MLDDLQRILDRDLDTLVRDLRLYPDTESLWRELPGLPTAGGNLALHVVGNLRHFIGAALGRSGYVRDRPFEFAAQGLAPEAVVRELEDAKAAVAAALSGLDPAALEAPFPVEINGLRPPTGRVLMHLVSHTAVHLGQVDYHRRAVTGDRAPAGLTPVETLA